MKKTVITITIVFILTLNSYIVYAGMTPPGYSLWASGDFDMPADINNIKNASELKPYLNGRDDFRQAAAIRKLGEIEGAKAVDTLKNYLKRDSTVMGYDALVSLTKLEAVRTLGRIGSEQAKTLLLDTLKLYLEKGPILPDKYKDDKRYFQDDRDFTYIVPELLKALYKWSSDNQVYEYIKNSNQSKNYIEAWEIYLNGEIIRKGVDNERDSTLYWLELENDLANKGKAYSEKNGIVKMNAVREILNQRISENVMNSLIEEFKKEQEKEPRDKGLTVRYLELRDKIDNLEYYIKSKKEAQAKLEAYKKQIAERR